MSSRLLRGIIGAAGVVMLVVGVRGIWVHRLDTRPGLGTRELLAFWLGGALLHDLVVVPVTVVVAVLVRRVVPAVARAWVLGALIVSSTVTLVAWPAVRGYGETPDNPSILPRDEVRGLVVILVVVWVAAAAGGAIAHVTRPRQG